MARTLEMVIMGTLVSTGLIGFGCSSDGGEDSVEGPGNVPQLEDVGETGRNTSTPASVSDEVFQTEADVNGDNMVTSSDILASGAGVSVEESDLERFKDSSCSAWQVEPEPLAASLFFVVDASSSMDAIADNTGGVDKWTVTRDAIAAAIESMPKGSQVGLLGYPNMVVTAQCVNVGALFEPQPLETARDALLAALNGIQTEKCTPTYDAYSIALDHFSSTASPGQKYILLMTDGTPTITSGCYPGTGECSAAIAGENSAEEILGLIETARDDYDIETFILGSPGSDEQMETGLDNRWWLSRGAEIGGTSQGGNCSHEHAPFCHFDMTEGVEADFATGLENAMTQILGQVAQCDYSIPPPTDTNQLIDLAAIHLVLVAGGTEYIEIYQSKTSDCTHGWYLGEDHRVKLCPATCGVVQADPLMELQWLFGCGNIPIAEVT